MTITAKSCAEFLRSYNDWRRGGEGPQPDPKEIGENIDFAITALESDADIATLEQESRQMRARMERLEKELETERALSFRNHVASLDAQLDALLTSAELLLSRKRPGAKEDDPRLVLEIDCLNLEDAIASVKEAS